MSVSPGFLTLAAFGVELERGTFLQLECNIFHIGTSNA
jgi:hypothetical protein